MDLYDDSTNGSNVTTCSEAKNLKHKIFIFCKRPKGNHLRYATRKGYNM